jgi:hypothetical protein
MTVDVFDEEKLKSKLKGIKKINLKRVDVVATEKKLNNIPYFEFSLLLVIKSVKQGKSYAYYFSDNRLTKNVIENSCENSSILMRPIVDGLQCYGLKQRITRKQSPLIYFISKYAKDGEIKVKELIKAEKTLNIFQIRKAKFKLEKENKKTQEDKTNML